jgi:amidase
MTIKDLPIHYLSMTQIQLLYEKREISPLEITQYMFDRIESIDPEFLSYATLMKKSALEKAEKLSSGSFSSELPMFGIPIAVKDLCYTNGVRTMGGTAVLENFIPTYDSTVVERLDNAGAILLGKLNLTEGAMGGYNPKRQVPKNPWDTTKWSGSSSSGSGVATAAGLCFGSLGSDTGGSIRYPSSACGIVGLKPTYGRVSRYGVLDLAQSLDHVGPMTRSVQDAWTMFASIKGYDQNDRTTIKYDIDEAPHEVNTENVIIGYDDHYATADGVNDEIVKSIRNVINVFRELKFAIQDVQMPHNILDFLPNWPILCTAEAALAHSDYFPSQKDDYGPWFRNWLEKGTLVTKEQYIEASIARDESNALIANSLKDVDILITPCVIDLPHDVDDSISYGPNDNSRAGTAVQKFTVPFDFNRYPSLTLPCGISNSGLPIALQIVGKPMSESLICAIGQIYEKNTDWNNLHPNI